MPGVGGGAAPEVPGDDAGGDRSRGLVHAGPHHPAEEAAEKGLSEGVGCQGGCVFFFFSFSSCLLWGD